MATIDIMDQFHLRENPWADTAYGKGSHVLAKNPSGGATEDQRQAQQALAEASSNASSECSTKSGMSRNVCRAEYVADNV